MDAYNTMVHSHGFVSIALTQMYDAKSANSPFNDSSSPFAGCPVPEAMEVRCPISRGPMYVVYKRYPVIFWCDELRKIQIFKWLSKLNRSME